LSNRQDKDVAVELEHLNKKVAEFGRELDGVRESLGTLSDHGGELAELHARLGKDLAEARDLLRRHSPAPDEEPSTTPEWSKTKPKPKPKRGDEDTASTVGSARVQEIERKRLREAFENNVKLLTALTKQTLEAIHKAEDKTIKDPEFAVAVKAANAWKKLFEDFKASFAALLPPDDTDELLRFTFERLKKHCETNEHEIISQTRPAERKS
jgi:hypothetical protein